MMKQNRLFSAIYIAGTGLSIALVMTVFIVIYVNTASIYPEYNRDRTLQLDEVWRMPKDTTIHSWWGNRASYAMVKMIRELPQVEYVCCAMRPNNGFMDNIKTVMNPETKTEHEIMPMIVDGDYWKVFDFEFVHGRPFSQIDVTSFAKVVVLSQSLARQMYATDDVAGRTISIDQVKYKVCGVVKDVPASMSSFVTADMWLPYDNEDDLNSVGGEGLMGDLSVLFTAKSSEDADATYREVWEKVRKYNEQDKVYDYVISENPVVMNMAIFRGSSLSGFKDSVLTDSVWYIWYVLIALMLVPAMNLSGLISSKMNDRLPELGIRKTYGASNFMLLSQVLWENMLLTLIGGVVGLILCYILVVSADEWIISLLSTSNVKPEVMSGNISIEMLFNVPVFCGTLLFCIILNVVSAMIPAVLALRNTIIESLNTKK